MEGTVKIKRHSATKTTIKVPKVIKGKTSTKQSNLCQNLPTLIGLRTGAMDVARSEAWYWTKNRLKESDPKGFAKLKEYYLAAIDRKPKHFMRSYKVAKNDADGRAKDASEGNKYWSAAFISYCYVKAYEKLNPGVVGWTLRNYAKCLRDNNLFNADVAHETYVDNALKFPGPVYKMVNTNNRVEVGDWIYKDRKPKGTHVDIVLEIFNTGTKDNPIKWALAAGGNIPGQTAGFKIYSLNAKGKLIRNHARRHRPKDDAIHKSIKSITLKVNQIKSWPNVDFNLMKGLVRLF